MTLSGSDIKLKILIFIRTLNKELRALKYYFLCWAFIIITGLISKLIRVCAYHSKYFLGFYLQYIVNFRRKVTNIAAVICRTISEFRNFWLPYQNHYHHKVLNHKWVYLRCQNVFLRSKSGTTYYLYIFYWTMHMENNFF